MLSCFPFLLQYFLPSFFPYFLCLELEAKEKEWHINIRKDLIEMTLNQSPSSMVYIHTKKKIWNNYYIFFT